MEQRAGELSNAFLRLSCMAACTVLNLNGVPLCISWTSGLACLEKFWMKIQHMPMLPRMCRHQIGFDKGPIWLSWLSAFDLAGVTAACSGG
jgi:hypothetical protein